MLQIYSPDLIVVKEKNMLKELNKYLKGNMSDDYWYDDAIFICEYIINNFSDDDWEKVKKIYLQRRYKMDNTFYRMYG